MGSGKGKHSLARRRRNLLAADPHCHWCGREVREYSRSFAKGEKIPEDMATLDHLNQKTGDRKPRPARGETVLSCWPCNNARGLAGRQREKLPCVECARLCAGQFCCGECFTVNRTRLGMRLLPQEEHRRQQAIARKKARNRRKMLRWQARRNERRQREADAA